MNTLKYLAAVVAMILGAVLTSCDEMNGFIVTFDSNGGSIVSRQIVRVGESVIEPKEPTRNGYIFIAWYKDVELMNEWKFNFEVLISDVTLYAKWQAIDPLFKINGLSIDNYPRVDGSTSAEPLNIIIACKLLDIGYKWTTNQFVATWGVEPKLKDNLKKLEKFRELIKSSQTHQSFINLIDNETDLILSARKMSSDEKKYADAAGVSLIETPIALDALVFIVNPKNPISSLTIQQVQDIYTGKTTIWKDVGGYYDEKINPYIRNANSGSQELMESLVMKDLDIVEFPETPEIIYTMMGAYDIVSADERAICFTIYYYKEMILRTTGTKDIGIDGIFPNKESLGNKSYPYTAEVYAVIRSDLNKSSMAYKLYELLQSENGKRIIAESGYIPN